MNHALLGPRQLKSAAFHSIGFMFLKAAKGREPNEKYTRKIFRKAINAFQQKTVIAEELLTRLQFFWHKQLNILNGRR